MRYMCLLVLFSGLAVGQQSAVNKSCNDDVAYIHPRLADLSELPTDTLERLAADLSVCAQLAELPPMTLRDLSASSYMIGFEIGLRASKAVKAPKGSKPSAARQMFAAFAQGAGQAMQAQASNPLPSQPMPLHCTVLTAGPTATIDCY